MYVHVWINLFESSKEEEFFQTGDYARKHLIWPWNLNRYQQVNLEESFYEKLLGQVLEIVRHRPAGIRNRFFWGRGRSCREGRQDYGQKVGTCGGWTETPGPHSSGLMAPWPLDKRSLWARNCFCGIESTLDWELCCLESYSSFIHLYWFFIMA